MRNHPLTEAKSMSLLVFIFIYAVSTVIYLKSEQIDAMSLILLICSPLAMCLFSFVIHYRNWFGYCSGIFSFSGGKGLSRWR